MRRPRCSAVRGLRTRSADATVPPKAAAAVGEAMYAFVNLVDTVIRIYIWLLIIQAVLSWLLAFGVVNRHNRFVGQVEDFLWRITEPALRPIRRVLPSLGGLDISPVILILLLYFLRNLMFEYLA
jgi:YggT family protein